VTPLLVCLGGGLGAVARLLVDGELRARRPRLGPWATAVINVTGSFVLGVLFGLLTAGHLAGRWELVLGTGVCGGYTTFSTATVETVRLVEQGSWRTALGYACGSLLGALAACAAGFALAS
jgi:CrcB protein